MDFSILTPHRNLRLGMEGLDKIRKSARFIIIESGGLRSVKEITNVAVDEYLSIIQDLMTYVLKVGENFIELAIGNEDFRIRIYDGQIGVLGYGHFNLRLKPSYLLFSGSSIIIRRGEKIDMPDTYYSFSYDYGGNFYLNFKNQKLRDFTEFKPNAMSRNKLCVLDDLTQVTWNKGDTQNGIKFDANGDGNVDSIYDYTLYNDIFIEDVSSEFITVRPIMALSAKPGAIVRIKGIKFFIADFDAEKRQADLLPVSPVRLMDALIPSVGELDRKNRIDNLIESIVEQIRGVNLIFTDKFDFKLIRDDMYVINDMRKISRNEDEFTNRISALATLIDQFDKKGLKKYIKRKVENGSSINYLEVFLEENMPSYDGLIIKNLRRLITLRSKKYPIHRDDKLFLKSLEELGFNFPPDWPDLWIVCLETFLDSLGLLKEALNMRHN